MTGPARTTRMTVTLAEFAANKRYDDLPGEVIDRLKVYLLDVLASGFVCARLPWARIVHDQVLSDGGHQHSSVFGQGHRVNATQAALVNGVMVGGFEAEHVGHVSHPAGTVTPAALAIAERDGRSGRDLLLATAVGYEVVARIGEGQTARTETVRGFHNPSVNGPFSAAVAVGSLLGFDTDTMANALGIAGSYSSGLTQYAFDGSMTKRLHLGHASASGVEAALLAQRGFTGPHAVLEGEYGYFNAFSPEPALERVLPGLGEEWLLTSLRIKAYACHATGQAIVAALQRWRRDHDVDPAAITSVIVRGNPHWSAAKRFWDREPTTLMGAQYSLPYTIAVALVRDLDAPLQFDETVLSDQLVRALARSMSSEVITGEHHTEYSELVITTADGEHVVTCGPYRGSMQDPAQMEDVIAKFERFSRHLLSPAEQKSVVDLVIRFDELDNVDELARLIRTNKE